MENGGLLYAPGLGVPMDEGPQPGFRERPGCALHSQTTVCPGARGTCNEALGVWVIREGALTEEGRESERRAGPSSRADIVMGWL